MSRFRFTLSHDVLGSQVISEPDGWKDSVLKLERDPVFHSLVEHYEGGQDSTFIFYGDNGVVNGGINFLLQVDQTYGFNSEVNLTVEYSDQSDDVFETLFTGQVDLSTLKHFDTNKMSAAVIRNDFWARFINKIDTSVNLQSSTDLYGNATSSSSTTTIRLTPQEVRLVSHSKASTFTVMDPPAALDTIQVDWDVVILDELKTKYHLPVSVNTEIPAWIFSPDYPGDYTFDIQLYMTCFVDDSGTFKFEDPDGFGDNDDLDFYIQINDDAAIQFTESTAVTIGEVRKFTYLDTHTLKAGDIIRVYGISDAAGVDPRIHYIFLGEDQTGLNAAMSTPPTLLFEFNEALTYNSYFKVTGDTLFAETEEDGFFVHSAATNILNRILGYSGRFQSSFFANGCAALQLLIKGLQLRGYSLSDKPFFLTFNKLWKGLNPIFNLGLGYGVFTGTEKIEVEEKHNFYDTSSVSVNFSNVLIEREYDSSVIYNKIEIGYTKWEAEGLSGLDDPQSKREYSTIIDKVKNPITLHSEFIAASLAIENTRRQGIEQAKDYKYDNETFIISCNPTPVGGVYLPELDENFDSITNLVNETTRYNIVLTPARAFLRWINVFNGCMQKYLSSVYKFVGGEGNYSMFSNRATDSCRDNYGSNTLNEGGDIAVTTDFLHLPELYTIQTPMTWDEYQLIRNNRKKAIGVSQTSTGHTKFLIKSCSFSIVKGKAVIQAWPKTPFTIRVIQ